MKRLLLTYILFLCTITSNIQTLASEENANPTAYQSTLSKYASLHPRNLIHKTPEILLGASALAIPATFIMSGDMITPLSYFLGGLTIRTGATMVDFFMKDKKIQKENIDCETREIYATHNYCVEKRAKELLSMKLDNIDDAEYLLELLLKQSASEDRIKKQEDRILELKKEAANLEQSTDTDIRKTCEHYYFEDLEKNLENVKTLEKKNQQYIFYKDANDQTRKIDRKLRPLYVISKDNSFNEVSSGISTFNEIWQTTNNALPEDIDLNKVAIKTGEILLEAKLRNII